MIDCGLASVYLENIQKLRACVIRHFGLDKSTGQRQLKVVPAVLPVLVRNKVKARIFLAYLDSELTVMIKAKIMIEVKVFTIVVLAITMVAVVM